MGLSVLIVEDDIDLGECLIIAFQLRLQASTIRVASLDEIQRHKQRVLQCHLAIIDVNLGWNQPTGLDIYDWLCAQGFAGKTVFLTGHAKDHPLVHRAHNLGNVPVYSKPLSLNQILALGSNL